jgi:hypothetical protein
VRGLDNLAPFLVDDAEAEALGLQTIPSEKEEGAADEGAAATSNGKGESAVKHFCCFALCRCCYVCGFLVAFEVDVLATPLDSKRLL